VSFFQQDSQFTSTADDSVHADTAAQVEREMQFKLDGQSVTLTMDDKSSRRKIPMVKEKKIHLDLIHLEDV